MKQLFLALFLSLMLSACHTMHFKRAASSPTLPSDTVGAQFDNWHHVGIFHLVEFSDPVTMASKQCRGWDSVIVERGILHGLVGGITWGLYAPWNADMRCS